MADETQKCPDCMGMLKPLLRTPDSDAHDAVTLFECGDCGLSVVLRTPLSASTEQS